MRSVVSSPVAPDAAAGPVPGTARGEHEPTSLGAEPEPVLDAGKLEVYAVALELQALASTLVPPNHRVLQDQLERASPGGFGTARSSRRSYGTGLRLRECQRLRLGDLDLAGRTLLIRDGKGRKDRIVPLPARADLRQGGADIRHVQALLGHRNLDTTALYTRVAVKDLRQVLEKCHPRHETRKRAKLLGEARR